VRLSGSATALAAQYGRRGARATSDATSCLDRRECHGEVLTWPH
jgi:hypothetical protein